MSGSLGVGTMCTTTATGGQRVADRVCHRGRGAHDARFPRPFHAERVVGDGVLDDDWENPEWIDFAIRCFFDRAA